MLSNNNSHYVVMVVEADGRRWIKGVFHHAWEAQTLAESLLVYPSYVQRGYVQISEWQEDTFIGLRTVERDRYDQIKYREEERNDNTTN